MTTKRHLCWQCRKFVDTVIEITTGDTKSPPSCQACLARALAFVRGDDPATAVRAPRGTDAKADPARSEP